MNDLTSQYVRPGLKHNPNLTFIRNEIKNYRYLCLPGGTRSGKTYSAIQFLWSQMDLYSGVKYSIARATLAALKATVFEDFTEIGTNAGLYTENNHWAQDKVYRHNGNRLTYFGLDGDEKIRGQKRDVLYLNEGPEITWAEMRQLQIRTAHKIIIDYNPSYPESWVYDNILTRKDCAFITSTFLDNPHLTKEQLDELAWMEINDPESYVVYGLGKRGELKGQVYKNWKPCKEFPREYTSAFIIDFGYTNDPAVIAEFCRHNKTIYGREHLYAKGMDNIDLAIGLFFAGAQPNSIIIADSAEPKSVGEMRRGWQLEMPYIKAKVAAMGYAATDAQLSNLKLVLAGGYRVLLALKGADSVDTGIQLVKQHEVLIEDTSLNAWRENRMYRWAEDKRTGTLLNAPVDAWNHFCDCLRYYALAIGRLV